jgi:hypothetical protein
MRRLPSFSPLRAFKAVARLGGFSLPCKKLRITPSTISQRALKRSARSVRALTVEKTPIQASTIR